jgi:hypothetical protein
MLRGKRNGALVEAVAASLLERGRLDCREARKILKTPVICIVTSDSAVGEVVRKPAPVAPRSMTLADGWEPHWALILFCDGVVHRRPHR